MFEECIADMYNKKVWEPVVNKQAQCMYVNYTLYIFVLNYLSRMATEVATSILKIDSVHNVNEILSNQNNANKP